MNQNSMASKKMSRFVDPELGLFLFSFELPFQMESTDDVKTPEKKTPKSAIPFLAFRLLRFGTILDSSF
jgi:hypothetical protein